MVTTMSVLDTTLLAIGVVFSFASDLKESAGSIPLFGTAIGTGILVLIAVLEALILASRH